VNRSGLIGGVAVALAGVVGVVIYLLQPAPRTAAPAAAPRAPSASASRVEAPAPVVPDAPPADAPRTPRRAPAPRPEAAPEPAPAPVVEAAPALGTLRVSADVPGAQVFLDRQFIGAAPVVLENVKPGTHQLNVSAEGFDSVAQSIEVEPGSRDIGVKLREVRLEARVAVVHKHGIGSCRGTLVATPQGLRYETSNKDDQFSSALADLETFQVDYLEKNLRIRLRRGRQFNFTDPDGNADRLFVFHRDVEKARERLRRGDPPQS
jgi:PEGA domain-containing protein